MPVNNRPEIIDSIIEHFTFEEGWSSDPQIREHVQNIISKLSPTIPSENILLISLTDNQVIGTLEDFAIKLFNLFSEDVTEVLELLKEGDTYD